MLPPLDAKSTPLPGMIGAPQFADRAWSAGTEPWYCGNEGCRHHNAVDPVNVIIQMIPSGCTRMECPHCNRDALVPAGPGGFPAWQPYDAVESMRQAAGLLSERSTALPPGSIGLPLPGEARDHTNAIHRPGSGQRCSRPPSRS